MKYFPHSEESEAYVLGVLLMEPTQFSSVSGILVSPEPFYSHKNAEIAKIIWKLAKEQKPFDYIAVAPLMSSSDFAENFTYLSNLTNRIGSGVNVLRHAQLVYEHYCRRKIIMSCEKLKKEMFDITNDLIDGVNEFERESKELFNFTDSSEMHIEQAAKEALDLSSRIQENGNEITGIPTGFTYFDKFSGGLQKGDLVVVAGETSNGKTTFALDVLQYACVNGKKSGAIFSYEMTEIQLAARLVGIQTGTSSKSILSGQLAPSDWGRITNFYQPLVNAELRIFKPSGGNFSRLVADIRRAKQQYNIDFCVIDYLQLLKINGYKGQLAQMFADMANDLKCLAVNLGIPIVLLSQLSRDKDRPRPTIGRLKGSGDIENAADTIIMPYIPAKYNRTEEEVNGEMVNVEGKAVIIVGKGRNIGTCEFLLDFIGEQPTFKNLSASNYAEETHVENSDPFDIRNNFDFNPTF